MSIFTKDYPVKRDIYKFKIAWFKFTTKKRMEHEYRYTLGEQLRKDILDMSRLVNIGLRKRSKSAKFGCYDSAPGLLDDIQDNFNMLNDLEVINNVKKAEFDIMIEGIERQLSGLLNSLDKSRKEAERHDGDIEGGDTQN